ncbi:MAG: helix-turn-helix domain-containing protein [Candidatus Nanoarchaeia archaeon]|nr:helix-turn-helix domain-containing protein [Candidatus Nanoarchaeia archaeon]
MNIKILERLGLSNTEAKVYLALLGLGSALANKIAEQSGVHRRTVYDTLEILMEKGLVNFVIESNRKWYQAESPERLMDMLKNREEELKEVLPELLDIRKLSISLQEATIYRGKKGLKNVFDDILKTKKSVFLFGSSGKFQEIFGKTYMENWLRKLEKSKIKMKIILSEKARDLIKSQSVESRYIGEDYILPSSTTIYGDYTLITIFSLQPFGMLVRSKETSESYLKYFELLWKIAKK